MMPPTGPAFLYVFCVIGAWVAAGPVQAQTRLDRAAIIQVVDAALADLIPPGKRLSRVPVAQRRVFFDHERTMAAFGHPGAPPLPLSELRAHTAVRSGSRTLLTDCDQSLRHPCTQLGWGVYAWIEPASVTASELVVNAHLLWPDRGSIVFEEGVAPAGRAGLVGFMAKLHFARLADGSWRFVKRGPFTVSE